MSPEGFAFVGGGFERAAHLRDQPDALDALWPRARVLRVDVDFCALDDARLDAWPLGAALAETRPAAALFLGLADSDACFALEQSAKDAATCDLRCAGMDWPHREAAMFDAATGVLNWRKRSRHCGGCGIAVLPRQAGWSTRCPSCGLESFPRSDPAMIVAVTSGDRLLLGRQARWPPGRWSLLAGFIEPGESLAQAVVREVFEEAGIRVSGVRFVADQPWPFPHSLMLGCVAAADADAPDPVVGDELEQARWFSRAEVGDGLAASDAGKDGLPPPLAFSPRLSISRTLIEAWWSGR